VQFWQFATVTEWSKQFGKPHFLKEEPRKSVAQSKIIYPFCIDHSLIKLSLPEFSLKIAPNTVPRVPNRNFPKVAPWELRARIAKLRDASGKNVQITGRFAQEWSNYGTLRARMVKLLGASRKNGRKNHSLKEEWASAALAPRMPIPPSLSWFFRPFLREAPRDVTIPARSAHNVTILARSAP